MILVLILNIITIGIMVATLKRQFELRTRIKGQYQQILDQMGRRERELQGRQDLIEERFAAISDFLYRHTHSDEDM